MTSVRLKTSAPKPSSVDNALTLLTMLETRARVRVSDAAVELGVANSTAHRILTTLVLHGFAEQDRSRAYRRGPRLAGVVPDVMKDSAIRTVHVVLTTLADALHETCHLVVLEGNGARFVDCAEATGVLSTANRVGVLLPAHTTAAGKSLLAELSSDELQRLYPRPTALATRAGRMDMATLRRELAATRRRGYAINVDESKQGITAIARTLRRPDGAPFGAIAVAMPSARSERSRARVVAEHLEATVSQAEALLRHLPPAELA